MTVWIETGRWEAADSEVDAFVEANIASFAAWDLAIFLNHNPDSAEPFGRLVELLARHEDDMHPAVDALVTSGVLVACDVEGVECYSLTPDEQTRRVLARFIQMASNRDHRLDFVRRVLQRITDR